MSDRVTAVLVVFWDGVSGYSVDDAIKVIAGNPDVQSVYSTTTEPEATVEAFKSHQRIDRMIRDAIAASQDDPDLV